MTDICVRHAATEDAERLVWLHYDAVHAMAREDYPQGILDSWSPRPDERRYAWMRTQIESDNSQILVAESVDGATGGFCMFSPSEGFVHAIYVAPGLARKGIGRELLSRAESVIAENGVAQAKLNASKNALPFYESEGYEVIERSTQGLADGSEMECFKMHKVLSTLRS